MTKARAAVIWSANIPETENVTLYQRATVLTEEYDCDFFVFGDCSRSENHDFEITSCTEREGVLSGFLFVLRVLYHIGILQRGEYEFVHTSYHPLTCFLGFLCSKVQNKWVHDIWDHPIQTVPEPTKTMAPSGVGVFLMKYIVYRVSLRLHATADMIILSVHPSISEELSLPEEKTVPIPNGTDLSIYTNIDSGNTDDFTVVYVGTTAKKLNAETMLKAVSLAAEQTGNISLKVVGEIRDEKWFEQRIKEHELEDIVETTGRIPHREALQLIADADVGLCLFPRVPEIDYTYPIKLFEYMALETVPVCSNLRGISSVIDDNVHGYLVSPESAKSTARAIIELHDSATEEMETAARERVTNYDWSIMNGKFGAALERQP